VKGLDDLFVGVRLWNFYGAAEFKTQAASSRREQACGEIFKTPGEESKLGKTKDPGAFFATDLKKTSVGHGSRICATTSNCCMYA